MNGLACVSGFVDFKMAFLAFGLKRARFAGLATADTELFSTIPSFRFAGLATADTELFSTNPSFRFAGLDLTCACSGCVSDWTLRQISVETNVVHMIQFKVCMVEMSARNGENLMSRSCSNCEIYCTSFATLF